MESNEVVVFCDKADNPEAVCYVWADNPVCNPGNSEELPAVPSRTDDLKGITHK